MKVNLIALIGSWNQHEKFAEVAANELFANNIVLHPIPERSHRVTLGLWPKEKDALERLAQIQIELADEVLVCNPDGYVAAAVRNLIQYALALKKPVRYVKPVKDNISFLPVSYADPPPPAQEVEGERLKLCPICRMPVVYRQETCASQYCVQEHRRARRQASYNKLVAEEKPTFSRPVEVRLRNRVKSSEKKARP